MLNDWREAQRSGTVDLLGDDEALVVIGNREYAHEGIVLGKRGIYATTAASRVSYVVCGSRFPKRDLKKKLLRRPTFISNALCARVQGFIEWRDALAADIAQRKGDITIGGAGGLVLSTAHTVILASQLCEALRVCVGAIKQAVIIEVSYSARRNALFYINCFFLLRASLVRSVQSKSDAF